MEWRAVIVFIIIALGFILFVLKDKGRSVSVAPPTITTRQKLLINELAELTAKHTALSQFLFDSEQQKESRYNITYTTADGQKKECEIIKASDSTAYITALTKQQITALETRITALIKELNTPTPCDSEDKQKSVSVAETSIIEELQRISREVFKGDTLTKGVERDDRL